MAEASDQTPKLAPPFVNIPGIANLRDIGGYGTTDQHHSIRRNLVYRAADPSQVTREGLARLKELGVTKVFDLRSIPEIQKQGPEWQGVHVDKGHEVFVSRGETGDVGPDEIERIWCPVFRDTDYGPEQVALRFKNYAKGGSDGFVKAYTDILLHGTQAYKTILTHLAQPCPSPCIIHCTAGKDRTGVFCALLYLLCGIPAQTIGYEYSLTDTGLAHMIPLFTERLLKNPALQGNEQGVANMISAGPDKMLATLEMIEQRFGGVLGYVGDLVGMTDEQIERIRSNLLTDEVPVFSCAGKL